MSSSPRARRSALALLALLGLAYPFIVYFGLQVVSPPVLVLALIAALGARLLIARQSSRLMTIGVPVALAVLVLAAFSPLDAIRLYPVIVSLVLAAIFAFSLLKPPSAIERIARLREPHLSPEGVAYTRKVTQVWLAFFIGNAAIAAWTAGRDTLELWTLYNGFLSYLLVGMLILGEMIVRRRTRAARRC